MKKLLLLVTYYLLPFLVVGHEQVSPALCSYYLQERVRTALFFFEMADKQVRFISMREFYQVKAQEALTGTIFCHNRTDDWREEIE